MDAPFVAHALEHFDMDHECNRFVAIGAEPALYQPAEWDLSSHLLDLQAVAQFARRAVAALA